MCDRCDSEPSPTRVFSPVVAIIISFKYVNGEKKLTAVPSQPYPLSLCLPCYRHALKSYRVADDMAVLPSPLEQDRSSSTL
jgi:hypothetical protein